eukprot:COSAG01_NODE_3870_length_5605_cov_4.345260_11_plen_71_part_00
MRNIVLLSDASDAVAGVLLCVIACQSALCLPGARITVCKGSSGDTCGNQVTAEPAPYPVHLGVLGPELQW